MRLGLVVVPAVLLCTVTASRAVPLAAGMRLPDITLTDQYDAPGSVGPETRCIIFTRDMSGGKLVEQALATDSGTLLGAAGALVVSDISRMPSLITKLFALPAMRKRPYRMLLDRDGKVTADVPSDSGKVTLLHLNAFVIERVEYIQSAENLRAALQAPVPANPS